MGELSDQSLTESFEVFFKETEPRLRDALSATLGSEPGREAAADALAFGWEHWDRVSSMENPAGYLYVVGRNNRRAAKSPMGDQVNHRSRSSAY